MRRRFLFAILAIAGLVLVLLWPRGKRVETVAVEQAPLTQSVVATGRVTTPARIALGSQVTALVDAISVREGDPVRAGQALVQLRAADADAAIEQARTQAAEARARLRQLDTVDLPVAEQALQQARANLTLAEAEHGRAEALVARQYFSRSRLDESRRQLDTARAQLRSAQSQRAAHDPQGSGRVAAQARLAQAEAALALAEARRALLTLRAPTDARVLARHAEPGDVAQAGATLLTLAADGETRIYATLDEKNLRYLREGAAARAVADAFPQQPFDAVLYYLSPAVDMQRGTVEIRLRAPEPPAFLRPDMTVSVEVVIGERERALVLPMEAVRDLDGDAPWVLVADAGRARKAPVRIGLRGIGRIEITEGLAAGDAAILPASGAREGDRVRPAAARG